MVPYSVIELELIVLVPPVMISDPDNCIVPVEERLIPVPSVIVAPELNVIAPVPNALLLFT